MATSLRAATLVALAVLSGVARAGESGETRTHPELQARLAAIRAVGILPPELKIFELTASNTRTFRPDWTDEGQKAVVAALETALRSRGLEPRRIAIPAADGPEGREFQEVQALYDVVAWAAMEATIAYRFPAKVARFEYGVGDVAGLLDALGVDALAFTIGSGTASSAGRKAVQAVSIILAGAYSTGVDRLVVGIVDRRGDLLWFGVRSSTSSDFRDVDGTASFVQSLTEGLPEARK